MTTKTSISNCLIVMFAIFAGEVEVYGARELSPGRPNIVFLLIDDLGWKDTGVTGSTYYETPAIDSLAKQGIRFSQAYSPHPVCGPSRAAILTGKAPFRLHCTGVGGKIDPSETTLAETFKAAGYRTFFAGKWHCGGKGRRPGDNGFDVTIGCNGAGQPGSYFSPYKATKAWPGRGVLHSRDVPGFSNDKPGSYLTDRLTDKSLEFIDSCGDQPFLLYLSHYGVHSPWEAKEEDVAPYREKTAKMGAPPPYVREGNARCKQRQDHPVYAGMVKSIDDSLRRIVDKLKEKELYRKTIVIFFSDNGGSSIIASKEKSPERATSCAPLRAGKGWCYEGGIRVPLIISYPEEVPVGRVSDQPVIGMDLYPTLLDLAGLPLNPKQHRDGVSLLPIIEHREIPTRDLLWYYPHKHGSGHRPSAAFRSGDYKLIHFLETNHIELYDLSGDMEEKNDLSREQPDRVLELKGRLSQRLRSVQTRKPTKRPKSAT